LKYKIIVGLTLILLQLSLSGCHNIDIVEGISRRNSLLEKTAIWAGLTQLDQFLQQPTDQYKAFGYIDTSYVQNFPPMADIISKPIQDVPVYGLFTWMGGSDKQWAQVTNVGFSNLRIGGAEWVTRTDSWAMPAVDTAFVRLTDSAIEAMYGFIGKSRDKFGTDFTDTSQDQAFIDSYLAGLDIFLGKYAPGGTFWTNNADPAFRPGGAKYKPLASIEIWNEPDQHYLTGADYWDSLDGAGKADLYARLLIASYNYIKSNSSHPEWNTVKVVGVSACGVSNGGPEFVRYVHEKLVEHGGHANYYDVLSWHPYTYDFGPDTEAIIINTWTHNINYHYSLVNDQKEIRSIMQEFGNGNKPVWFTEVGWTRPNGVFPTESFAVNEYMQAAYTARLYLIAMRLGVERVHVMFVIDADGWNAGFFNYNNNYSWYKQARAVHTMIQLMPKPKITASISDGTNGYYAYKINPNTDDATARTVIAAWNVEKPLVVNLECDPGDYYTVYNMLGYASELKRADSNHFSVTIGPYPVYVVIEKK
jgi:hypothetical protein